MTTTNLQPYINHAEQIAVRENLIASRLTDVQETAIDLYQRGWNVIPAQWKNKKPYKLLPVYVSRLHLCTSECHHKPLPPEQEFSALFRRTNIAAVMGRTSDNLLAVDCDSQDSFQNMGRELDRRGLPYWAIRSHRGGAYLMRLTEGEAANQPEGTVPGWPDVQVWGNRHYVMIPPSLHPKGTFYQWYTPEPRYCLSPGANVPPVSVTALEWLGVKLQKDKQAVAYKERERFDLPEWATLLSQNSCETWANGRPEKVRNTSIFSLACDLCGINVSYDLAYTACLDAAQKCTPPLSEHEVNTIVKSAYEKKRTSAREYMSGKPSRHETWKQAESFAASFDWRGKFGRKANKRRDLFLASVKRASMDRRQVFRASVRELAEITGRDKKRVALDLKDLQSAGLLVYVLKNKSGTHFFQFGEDVVKAGYNGLPTVTPTGSCSVGNSSYQKTILPGTDAEKDVFNHLGNTAWHAWRYLLTGPTATRYKLAKALGLPSSSVYAAVSRLIDCHLITYSPAEGLFYGEAVTDDTLVLLAVDLGTNGKAEKRCTQHKQERELFANLQMAKAIAHNVNCSDSYTNYR